MNIGRLVRNLFRDDEFRPRMPDVEDHPNLDALFARARLKLSDPQPFPEDDVDGRRAIAVVTPGREITLLPCPAPGSMADEHVAPVKALLPPEPPLNVAAVAYTSVEALARDKDKTRCIPFLSDLVAFGYIGHSVVVFEGHPSAFESGVRDSDVLIVDSGMKPFLQSDWAGVARRLMRPGAKISVFDRKTGGVSLVVDSGTGGQAPLPFGRPGEAVYADLLLTVLAAGQRPSVMLTSGSPLPPLADFSDHPVYLERAARLTPESLNADAVIDIILNAAQMGARNGVLKMPLYSSADGRPMGVWTFHVELQRDAQGRRQILIER